ncbi:MAG TPA: hypothetical protein VFY39_05785 [Gammaproteobacteria bacterium]|nr:hypothetical protein [Gammaproteobacteria bacterium]
MASRAGVRSGRPYRAHARRRRAPLLWSVMLHAALLAAAAHVPWSSLELRSQPRTTFVWLTHRPPRRAQEHAAQSASPPQSAHPQARTTSKTAESIRRLKRAEPATSSTTTTKPSTAAAQKTASQPGETTQGSRTTAVPKVFSPGVDWEAELQRALEQLGAERQREHRYRTFSLEDSRGTPPPKNGDPWRDVLDPLFDASRGSRESSRHILAVGQARTRFGRALSRFCHALTGGFGISLNVFQLGSACADLAGWDLDSPIRPAALKWLPDCTPVPGARPSIAEQDLADTSMKCRMRARTESPADRAKAGDPSLDAR